MKRSSTTGVRSTGAVAILIGVLLINAGAPIAKAFDLGDPDPLMLACKFNDTDSALEALKRADDVNVTSGDEGPPLVIAASFGNTVLVEALLARGADTERKNAQGRTAILEAAIQGETATVEILRQHHASTAVADDMGLTFEAAVHASQPEFAAAYMGLLWLYPLLPDPTPEDVLKIQELQSYWDFRGTLARAVSTAIDSDTDVPNTDSSIDKALTLGFAVRLTEGLTCRILTALPTKYRSELLNGLQRAYQRQGYALASSHDGTSGQYSVLLLPGLVKRDAK